MFAELADGRKLEFPDGTDPAVIQRTVKSIITKEAKPELTLSRAANVAMNAGDEAVAGLPDMLLNAPNRVMNLGKSAFGAAASAFGRPDLAPELTPDPDYARRALKAIGAIRDDLAPKTPNEQRIAALSGGAIGAAASPARSIPQMLSGMLMGAASGEAGNEVGNLTGNDAAAVSASLLAPRAIQGMANSARESIANKQLQQSRNTVEDSTLAAGRDAGYVLPPTHTVNDGVRGFINRQIESIGGKAAIKQEVAGRNQQATNDAAANDLGLQNGTALTEGVLNNYRNQQSEPYRRVAAIDPHAAQTLEDLQNTRAELSVARSIVNRATNMVDVRAARDEARQLEQRAGVLENAIEAMGQNSGQPELVTDLRQARQQIAKSHQLERALNDGNADVSAPKLGAMRARNEALSGNMRTAAEFSNAFSPFTTEGAKIPTPGVSKSQWLASLLLGGGGAAAVGPAGAAAAAIPLASGPARALALSPAYQRLMATRNYTPSSAERLLSQIPQADDTQLLLRSLLAQQRQGSQL